MPVPFFDNPKDGYEMILVPAGEAVVGKPRFRLYLPDYYLGKYPVRNREYAYFLDQVRPSQSDLEKWILLDSSCHVVSVGGGYRVRDAERKAWEELENDEEGWGNHPVVQVSWYGAQAYCEWAGMRLPTELEWEKGARGVKGEVYPWGDEWGPSKCRNNSNSGNGRTSVVWEYPEGCSVWGHYQMSGNVWEWCGDWYDQHAYQRYAKGDLKPSGSGTSKVLRGGSWFLVNPTVFRCANRDIYPPGSRRNYLGFRCVRETDAFRSALLPLGDRLSHEDRPDDD